MAGPKLQPKSGVQVQMKDDRTINGQSGGAKYLHMITLAVFYPHILIKMIV